MSGLTPRDRSSIVSSVVHLVGGGATADTTGVRGLLRHHLAHATSAIVCGTLIGAAVLGLGNASWLLLLAAFAAGGVVLDLLFARTDNRLSPELGFRLVLASWPLAFVVLGAAGWAGDQYHGEVVALVALLVSGLVALAQPLRFTVLWVVVATAAVAAGAALAGSLGPEPLLAAGAVAVGAAFGNRLRHVIEEFLGTRRRLLHEVTGVRSSDDPFAMATALVEPLVRNTLLTTASIMWFTDDGRTVMLAVLGRNVPAYLTPGSALPDNRNDVLRRQAESGPWITGWSVAEGDAGYTRGIAAMGVDTVAYMPIAHQGRIIGLLGAAIGNAGGGPVTMAEHIPILAEVADVAAATLGPAISKLEVRSSAIQLIDEILAQRRYWPVFQPVRNLATDQIVGYEALSRFDAPVTTQRLFVQAGLLGRQLDLEIATLRAAVTAAAALPPGSWVSVNSSASLLVETETIGSILKSLDRPVVIELSEHDIVTDYEPIGLALKRLGPGCTLAVDDAGAGFASLRHILEVRPAYVKLDIGLVQGVATDLTRRALIAGFVHFARDARFALIAEGIEEPADLRMLKKLGVSLGQGFLLGRPERAADLAASLARRPARSRRRTVVAGQ
jgi:EAL domain-containing protein (putative c-di-GMP-specific phosphodiesterase class I)